MVDEASGYTDDLQWLLPPTVTPGARPIVPTTAFVYLLSANAQSPDAAVASNISPSSPADL